MTNAWGRAGEGLPVLIQRRLDLPWSTGSYPAAAEVVSKSHSEKCFDYPNKTYLADPSNGALVLQLVGAEPAAEYGELAVGFEIDLPGERRNYDAAVAVGT